MDTLYTTQTGDTIFGIASQAYGDPTLYGLLYQANPSLPITATYPAGLVLVVPVIENRDPVTTVTLPPWKQ